MKRTRKLPGSYSDDEIAKVETDAEVRGCAPTEYVRERLGLPQVQMGNPELLPDRRGGMLQIAALLRGSGKSSPSIAEALRIAETLK